MNEHDAVKALLARAAAEPTGPADPDALFARARALRRRRRAGLAVAAVLLTVAGTALPALTGPDRTAPAAPSPVDRLRQLLPPGIGTVEWAAAAVGQGRPGSGGLDGVYWIRKDGRLGVLRIQVGPVSVPLACTPELPGTTGGTCRYPAMQPSGTLVVTDLPGDDPAGARLVWARSHDVVLLLGDGRAVSVDSIAGYHGAEAPAPAMDAPPLTVEQTVDLARGLERMVREDRAH